MDERISASWATVGHMFAKQVLAKQLVLASIPHAYIFFGPEGVGKKTLALELAEKLGTSRQAVLEFSFKDSNTEDLRNFLSTLSFRPSAGARQVAVLDSCELMHIASSNTLLKVLEEPTQSTTIILISTKRNLPSTILSRAQMLSFGYLSQEELTSVVRGKGLVYTEDTLKFAFGRASEFIKLITNKDELDRRKQWQRDLGELTSGSMFTRLAVIQEWAKQETSDIEQRLGFWITQEMMAVGTGKLALKLGVFMEAFRRLSSNGNKRMVLEYLCLNLG